MDWETLTKQILQSLDIRAEYESLGVRIPANRKPTGKGYLACWAYGREDSNPSAAINVSNDSRRGRYVDRGASPSVNLSFFDFCATYFPDRWPTFLDAKKSFSAKVGIKVPSTTK